MIRRPRNCWTIACYRCERFMPRRGGKFYRVRGIKVFRCAQCELALKAA